MSDTPNKYDVKFAEKIGRLDQGLKDLSLHFSNHLSDHIIDRKMQWGIIALQVVVLLFLGYGKFSL